MIFVECKPDKALVDALTGRAPRHHEGKDKLLNKLMKEKRTKGMVDQDPRATQHHYLNKMRSTESRHDIIFASDAGSGNAVAILCPALEEWLLKTIRESGENFPEIPNNEKTLRNKLTVHPELVQRIVFKLLPKSERLKTLKRFLEGSLE